MRREIAALTRKLLALSRDNEESRRLMTVPGIGPITALAFYAAVDEPGCAGARTCISATCSTSPATI